MNNIYFVTVHIASKVAADTKNYVHIWIDNDFGKNKITSHHQSQHAPPPCGLSNMFFISL